MHKTEKILQNWFNNCEFSQESVELCVLEFKKLDID